MDLKRCENGHFYDAERFNACPHCANMNGFQDFQDKTEPFDESFDTTMPLSEKINETKNSPVVDEQKTIGFFNKAIGSEPVVGWLVCIEGARFGEDFKLKSGRNFIGRSKNMDVCLEGDSSISREKHAIILYEPKNNMFIAQPGESKELFYLNDKVVLSSEEIKANDIISLGETKLLFIPCCTESFKWNDDK